MLEFVLFALGAYSMAFGWIESDMPLIRWGRAVAGQVHPSLASCYHCVGLYTSILSYLLVFHCPFRFLTWAMAGSGAVLVIQYVMARIFILNQRDMSG